MGALTTTEAGTLAMNTNGSLNMGCESADPCAGIEPCESCAQTPAYITLTGTIHLPADQDNPEGVDINFNVQAPQEAPGSCSYFVGPLTIDGSEYEFFFSISDTVLSILIKQNQGGTFVTWFDSGNFSGTCAGGGNITGEDQGETWDLTLTAGPLC